MVYVMDATNPLPVIFIRVNISMIISMKVTLICWQMIAMVDSPQQFWMLLMEREICVTWSCISVVTTNMQMILFVLPSHKYCSNGPWYNWVMLRWEKSPGVDNKPEWYCVEYLDDQMVILTQMLACVAFPVEFDSSPANILAVIKTCGFGHKKGSIFSTIYWHTEMVTTRPESGWSRFGLIIETLYFVWRFRSTYKLCSRF
jgi:hypothetical protein